MDVLLVAYLKTISKNAQSLGASERTHYSALEKFIEEHGISIGHPCDALIELKNQQRGIPDFVVNDDKGRLIGHIEAKDLGENLEKIETTQQLRGYLSTEGYANLILTNYTQWRLYKNGKLVDSANVADPRQLQAGLAVGFGEKDLNRLMQDFFSVRTAHIRSPQILATKLAEKAKILRDRVVAFELKQEKDSPLNDVYHVFKQYLLPDIDEDKFADIYAQTITYGLFVARLHAPEGEFTRQSAEEYVPGSMPLLRSVFGYLQGAQTPKAVLRLVDEIVDLLAATKVPELKSGLARKKRSDDPIVYFYEDFLDKYNKKEKEQLGQWYTPIQVVGYMVRSVQSILQKDFGFELGLADPKVHILDPATGTGTFPAEVIRFTLEYLKEIGQPGSQKAVLDDLLTRVSAFEIQMASYVVAHIKLDVLLGELGLSTTHSPRIYLTNTLDNQPVQSGLGPMVSDLVQESSHALEVKNQEKVLVIIGNPPYSGESANKNVLSINKLMHGIDITKPGDSSTHNYFDFKDGKKEKNPKWVNDDYVKFFRFAQWKIEQAGEGIVTLITNHMWLENPTFRAMREALLDTFDDMYIYDLHGNQRKSEVDEDGKPDGNIFGIMQGVAITILVKTPKPSLNKTIKYADIFGTKEEKLAVLDKTDINKTAWVKLLPMGPDYYLSTSDEDLDYNSLWALDDIFSIFSTGVITARDKFVYGFNKASVENRIRLFADSSLEEMRQGFKLRDTRETTLEKSQKSVLEIADISKMVVDANYRPYDYRFLFYDKSLVRWPVNGVMKHMVNLNNVALLSHRQIMGNTWCHSHITNKVTDVNFLDSAKSTYVFPLWLHDDHSESLGANCNIKAAYLKEFATRAASAAPETVFAYIYAVLYAPSYRLKYADQLRRKFPRIPWPESDKQFKKLANLGQKLIDLHLQKVKLPTKVTFKGSGSGVVSSKAGDIKHEDQKIFISPENWFVGVPEEIWNYQIGGYKVLQQWLKYRKGKTLSIKDTTHFCQTTAILERTIKLQAEIDQALYFINSRQIVSSTL